MRGKTSKLEINLFEIAAGLRPFRKDYGDIFIAVILSLIAVIEQRSCNSVYSTPKLDQKWTKWKGE
jgi:hypothetical protein